MLTAQLVAEHAAAAFPQLGMNPTEQSFPSKQYSGVPDSPTTLQACISVLNLTETDIGS